MEDLFQKYKTFEQCELKDREISLLRKSLAESKEDYRKIFYLRRRFMQNGKYHHVLQTWQKEFDAIFNLAERHLK